MSKESMIDKTLTAFKADADVVIAISDKLYSAYFEKYFKRMRRWYDMCAQCDITKDAFKLSDTDIESALADLPLELFRVSEELSRFKLNQDVIRLKIKELEAQAKQNKVEDPAIDYNKLVQSIYASVVNRVESEVSFSREFIMVMKKFWDSRRATEQVNPVRETAVELPEYEMKSNVYIK